MRNVQQADAVTTPASGSPAGSPASGGAAPSSSSNQQQQSTQYRIARIQFASDLEPDVARHDEFQDEFTFDLRSPVSESETFDRSVRVMTYYIGDEPNDDGCDVVDGSIRTLVEEIPDDGLQTILLDSGADASVFPMSMCECGVQSEVCSRH